MISKNISEERLAELRCAFDLFDTDKDGKVDPKEIAGSFSKMGQQLNEEDLKEMTKIVDCDYKGKIDFEEFVAIFQSKLKDNDTEEEIYEAFKIFNKKGTGLISKKELKHILSSLHEPLGNDEIEDIMKQWDLDHDGFLNYEEFKNMMIHG